MDFVYGAQTRRLTDGHVILGKPRGGYGAVLHIRTLYVSDGFYTYGHLFSYAFSYSLLLP
jgi:hypothetical protein